MDFLYRERGAGKRAVKPSKDSELLEAILGEESDDSDFEVGNHADPDGSDDGDSGEESDATEGSSDNENEDEEADNESEASEDEEDELMSLRKKLTTFEVLDAASRHRTQTSATEAKGPAKVCGTCLGTRSDDSDEIVECDSCGISVHEACYGIQESGSIASNISDASTEPWFCEPCRANVKDPTCQVCPMKGGIFKETDMGNWIHLVCALYTPNISFFDPQRITRATLFELNYQNWGRRACTLCTNVKLARCGICIECDAGMCKSFFHVSCAQEHGLLSEPKEDDHESYFGHCRMHSDKDTIRRRKRNYLTYLLRSKERFSRIQSDINNINPSEDNTESAMKRILRKLGHQQRRWASSMGQPAWVPTQKMPRSLLTSSSAVNHLLRKVELQGWNVAAMDEAEANREILADINKRWGVAPAMNVEFVAYYHDRNSRIDSMQEGLASTVLANNELADTQAVIRDQYARLVEEGEALSLENAKLQSQISKYHNLLTSLDSRNRLIYDSSTSQKSSQGGKKSTASKRSSASKGLKTTPSSQTSSMLGSICSPINSALPCSPAANLGLHACHLCAKTSDQHLLALCDVCRFHYHLGCMTPPLERMPKKTRQYGWQCSECDKDPIESFNSYQEVVDVEAPRASRKRRSRPTRDSSDLDPTCVSPAFQSPLSSPSLTQPTPPPALPPPASSASPAAPLPVQSSAETSSSAAERLADSAISGPPVVIEKLSKKPTVSLPRIKKRKLSDSGPAGADVEGVSNHVPVKSRPSTGRDAARRRSERPKRQEAPASETEPTVKAESNLDVSIGSMSTTLNSSAESASILNSSNDNPSVLNSSAATVNGHSSPDLSGKSQPEETKVISPTLEDKLHFKDWLGKNVVSSPKPPSNPLEPVNGVLGDTLSDGKADSDCNGGGSIHQSIIQNSIDTGLDSSEVSKRRERKRLKKEEKEKRREEKRKMKAMMSANIVPDADIEESDDSCVVRIAPKPIKIKIKPIIPPSPPVSTTPSTLSSSSNAISGAPLTSPTSSSYSPYMHPKKKMVQMDSINNRLNHSQPPTPTGASQPIPGGQFSTPPPHNNHVSSIDVHAAGQMAAAASQDNATAAATMSLEATRASTPVLVNGVGRERRTRTPAAGAGGSAVRRAQDTRTNCDVCHTPGTNSNLVRCDECLKCYHFTCLNPPVKKTPKIIGWSWACSDCAPSDEDKSWHL